MIDNKWFCEPNDARESWCFLSLKVNKKDVDDVISGWEICYGNPNRVTRMATDTPSNEKEVIKGLIHEIYYCRKKDIDIITFGNTVIPLLRTRIVFHGISDVSLRSVKFLSIKKILQDYFFIVGEDASKSVYDFAWEMNIEEGDMAETELLRDVFLKIGALLPVGVIQ